MRMTPEQLEDLTGFTQASAQIRWFRDHFGVSVPADRAGPIVTAQAVEGMVARRCGLEPAAVVAASRAGRQQVRLTRAKA